MNKWEEAVAKLLRPREYTVIHRPKTVEAMEKTVEYIAEMEYEAKLPTLRKRL